MSYCKDKATIRDRREMLQVKAHSLMLEARLIRRKEQRPELFGPLQVELYLHRKNVVRPAARATSLALGFIKGRTLKQMEPTAKSKAPIEEVKRLLKKYGELRSGGPKFVEYAGDLSLETARKQTAVPA